MGQSNTRANNAGRWSRVSTVLQTWSVNVHACVRICPTVGMCVRFGFPAVSAQAESLGSVCMHGYVLPFSRFVCMCFCVCICVCVCVCACLCVNYVVCRYSECVWPGRVKEVIVDTVEALLCRQQALERLSPTRATDDDIASEPVLCIEWYNHYTRDRRHGSGTDSVSNTTNDFLECELTPFTPEVFKDNWRKRSHIRVGSASHLGDRFNRAVFQALMDWEADQVRGREYSVAVMYFAKRDFISVDSYETLPLFCTVRCSSIWYFFLYEVSVGQKLLVYGFFRMGGSPHFHCESVREVLPHPGCVACQN